jgi:hypothetical protein
VNGFPQPERLRCSPLGRLLWILIGAFSAACGVAAADPQRPQVLDPGAARWSAPPGIAGLEAVWLLGDRHRSEPYLLHVALRAGAVIPPHRHPDARQTIVLDGVLHVGFGTIFDADALVAVPAGSVYAVPAGVPHFLAAPTGPARYQETGCGPTATEFIAAGMVSASGSTPTPAPRADRVE